PASLPLSSSLFLSLSLPPPRSRLFPYTTLFRSCRLTSVLLLRGPRIAGAGWTRTPYRRRRTSRASVTLRASPHPVPMEHAGWWLVRAATVGDHGPRSRRRPRAPGPGTSARARAPQPHLVGPGVPVQGRGAGRRPHGLASGAPGRARRRRFRAGGHRGD